MRCAALCACWLVALACGDGADAPEPAADEPTAAPTASVAAGLDPARRISGAGIGAATRGRTLGDLRAALGPDERIGAPEPYMVDLDGLPVIAGADTLYRVLVQAGTTPTDAAPIELVATTNPTFRTAEGVGAGSTLADAAARYGAVTLRYNVNDESREYASFERFTDQNVLFRVGPDPETSGFAGRYTTQGEVNTTTSYDATARIRLVLVMLR